MRLRDGTMTITDAEGQPKTVSFSGGSLTGLSADDAEPVVDECWQAKSTVSTRFTAARWASGRIRKKRRKPRHRISYTLCVEGHWWQGGRWVRSKDVDWSRRASTHARFRTAKRAWREFDRAPEPVWSYPGCAPDELPAIDLTKRGTGSSGQRWRRWTYVAEGL